MDLDVGQRCYRCGAVTADEGLCRACQPFLAGEPVSEGGFSALPAIALGCAIAAAVIAFGLSVR